MDDLVTFLRGRLMTDDGTPVPQDSQVERLCNGTVRQQVYASPGGDFSMQLGSVADSFVDASGEPATRNDRLSQDGITRTVPGMGGIPRSELRNCELRASVFGFRSSVATLVDLHPFSGNIDVGAIVLQRTAKIKGMAVSAALYKAPPDARKAYERGLEAERHSKLAEARQYFEKAVKIYPKFAYAWFMLGNVLQKDNQNDAARAAYTKATTIDTKFLQPYSALASMAYKTQSWRDVRDFTGHILDLDPLNYAEVTGDILDLDPLNYAEIYFYNSHANYKLDRIDEAEKSGLKAERLALRAHFPQLHLLMAEIFARKKNYASAIAEIHTYLDLASPDTDVAQVRERLADLEKLSSSQPSAPN
jgi:Tetratricopeptide repeat